MPATAADTPPPIVLVAAVALVDTDGRVLLAQRPAGKSMAGLWEFPGGKVDTGETPETALIRELAEETGTPLTWPRSRQGPSCRGERLGVNSIVGSSAADDGADPLAYRPGVLAGESAASTGALAAVDPKWSQPLAWWGEIPGKAIPRRKTSRFVAARA